MVTPSAGVAAAKRAAAESRPCFPQAYELTPHWSRSNGTCILGVVGVALWYGKVVVLRPCVRVGCECDLERSCGSFQAGCMQRSALDLELVEAKKSRQWAGNRMQKRAVKQPR